MPSLPHHLPQPRRNQSPDKRPQRIHHQIRYFENAHMKNQLEALDAERQAEGRQHDPTNPPPGTRTRPIQRGK